MRRINCKKCGTRIDASQGECPVCGAIYYVLDPPREDGTDPDRIRDEDAAPNFDPDRKVQWAGDGDTTVLPDPKLFSKQAGDPVPPAQNMRGQGQSGPRPGYQSQDAPYRPRDPFDEAQGRSGQRPPQGPRSAPSRQQGPQRPRPRPPARPGDGRGDGAASPTRKKGLSFGKMFLLAAVALLAILTLVIAILTGAFDFGGGSHTMPDIIGKTQEQAVELLEKLDVVIKITHEDSDEQPQGYVFDFAPKKGSKLIKNQIVEVFVSSGPKDSREGEDWVTAPNLLGKTYNEASTAALNLGLRINRLEDDYSSSYPAGQIIRQFPSYMSEMKEGETIDIVISRGPEPSTPPSPSPSPTPAMYTIEVTKNPGGTVSPSGRVSVGENGDKVFTFTPNSGYEIREVKVDGVSQGAISSYSFQNVRANHSIYVIFQAIPPATPSPAPSPTPPAETPDTTPSQGQE